MKRLYCMLWMCGVVHAITYVPYNTSNYALQVQLQPFLRYSTQQLEEQLLTFIKAGIPTENDIMRDPSAVELFADRLDKTTNMLRAYHYRPLPLTKKITFTPRSDAFEKSIETWLSAAQPLLEGMQEVRTKALRKERVLTEIDAIIQTLSKKLEDYKARKKILPYMIKDLQAGVDRFTGLQKEYKNFMNKPYDDKGVIARINVWIDQQKK